MTWSDADGAADHAITTDTAVIAAPDCAAVRQYSNTAPYIVSKSSIPSFSSSLSRRWWKPRPKLPLKPITTDSCEAKTLVSWVECWRRSNLPLPNLHLTINLPVEEILETRFKGKGASSVRRKIFNSIAHLYGRHDLPWLCVWAMESDRGIHVHVLLWAPEGRKFREQLANLLIDRLRMPRLAGYTAWGLTRRRKSHSPAYFTPIDEKRWFRRTGRHGLDGACDYVAKDVDKNAFGPIVSKRLGVIVGASKPIRIARRAAGTRRSRRSKLARIKTRGATI
jgi:hypothetical protein